MKYTLRIAPAVLASLLLGAHYYRAGSPVLALICVALPPLLLAFRPWGPVALRGLLLAGAAVWVRTAWRIARLRQAHDQPYGRMLGILLGVAALTVFAAVLVGHRSVRRTRQGEGRPDVGTAEDAP